MKKIYILFLAFILAGCSDVPPIESDDPPNELIIDPIVEDIVKDVASGQQNYIGKTVRIKGIVKKAAKNFTPVIDNRTDQITIKTGSWESEVAFFILSDEILAPSIEPNKLITTYEPESSYDFYIFIAGIRPHRYIRDGYEIISYLIRDEIHTMIDTFVSDVRLKNQDRYINSIIYLEGGAQVISGPAIIRVGVPDFVPEEIYLKTKHRDVFFAVKDYTSPTNRLDQFEDGSTYNFVLFILRIDENPDLLYATINSLLVVCPS